jgi:uncharacterized phiE125 gp8 family phage protein
MSVFRTAASTGLPISLEAVKELADVSESYDDAKLTRLIATAAEWVENQTGMQLLRAGYRLKLDRFPRGGVIELPHPPLVGSSSGIAVTYLDGAGAAQTLSSTAYRIDADSMPGRLVRRYGQEWPETLPEPQAVTVTYQAGYGIDDSDVPKTLSTAVGILAKHLYDLPDPVVTGTIATELPLHVQSILGSAGYGAYGGAGGAVNG